MYRALLQRRFKGPPQHSKNKIDLAIHLTSVGRKQQHDVNSVTIGNKQLTTLSPRDFSLKRGCSSYRSISCDIVRVCTTVGPNKDRCSCSRHCHAYLVVVMVVHPRPVLGSLVVSLSVCLRGVVSIEENSQKVLERRLLRVEEHLYPTYNAWGEA